VSFDWKPRHGKNCLFATVGGAVLLRTRACHASRYGTITMILCQLNLEKLIAKHFWRVKSVWFAMKNRTLYLMYSIYYTFIIIIEPPTPNSRN